MRYEPCIIIWKDVSHHVQLVDWIPKILHGQVVNWVNWVNGASQSIIFNRVFSACGTNASVTRRLWHLAPAWKCCKNNAEMPRTKATQLAFVGWPLHQSIQLVLCCGEKLRHRHCATQEDWRKARRGNWILRCQWSQMKRVSHKWHQSVKIWHRHWWH